MQFKQALATGKTGESNIAQWLIAKGNKILPVYEIAEGQYKGPTLYSQAGSLIAPDMLVFDKTGNVTWLEIKTRRGYHGEARGVEII